MGDSSVTPDVHEHRFTKPELVRITKIDNDKYQGIAGDKAFLMRSCVCGKREAYDYGAYKEMEAKLPKPELDTKGEI